MDTTTVTTRPEIPGQYSGEPVFGDVCPADHRGCTIALDEYRYLKDVEGNQTSYIRRTRGRQVNEIATDLTKAIRRYNFEWATLGQTYKYNVLGDSPTDECPKADRIAVYVTHGGSEGHLVHVDIQWGSEERTTTMTCKTLFMVKTFGGAAYAQKIATKIAKLLGVL